MICLNRDFSRARQHSGGFTHENVVFCSTIVLNGNLQRYGSPGVSVNRGYMALSLDMSVLDRSQRGDDEESCV